MLEQLDAIIIAKVHPVQEKSILIDEHFDRILLFSEITQKCVTNLQELLVVSDLLITDYSTTFYDFLNLNRPILYYAYDEKRMSDVRGFFINPIMPMYAGLVSYTIPQLCEMVRKIIQEGDPLLPKREYIHSLINMHKDGHSAERIANYFLS